MREIYHSFLDELFLDNSGKNSYGRNPRALEKFAVVKYAYDVPSMLLSMSDR